MRLTIRAASAMASPFVPSGSPFPSQRSNVCDSGRRTSSLRPRRVARSLAASQWLAIIASASLCPPPAKATATRARSQPVLSDPTRAAMNRFAVSPAKSVCRTASFSPRSSPNHLACSYASMWQPTHARRPT